MTSSGLFCLWNRFQTPNKTQQSVTHVQTSWEELHCWSDRKNNATFHIFTSFLTQIKPPDCWYSVYQWNRYLFMMTSLNGIFYRVTSEEFTIHRWIPFTKASDAELWCFLWSAPWINGWVNNHEAGDLRRHCAHYDGIVMSWINLSCGEVNKQIFAEHCQCILMDLARG